MSENTAPTFGATWFNLSRHDEDSDGGEATAEEAADTGGDDDADAERKLADAVDGKDDDSGEGDSSEDAKPDDRDALGDKGQRALQRERREKAAAKKEAAAAKKQLAELTRKVQEFEDRDRSDLEKATAKADRLAGQATKATARAVQAEVRSLAVGQFADATDAVDVLMRDPSKYVDSDGEIDTDAIETDLADLLDRKPHWAKPAPAAAPTAEQEKPKPRPKPDPGQGSRGAPADVDFRDASKDDVAKELLKYGFRQRA